MNLPIIFAIAEDILYDIRERLEIILRALYILNPPDEEEEEEEEDKPPPGLYS